MRFQIEFHGFGVAGGVAGAVVPEVDAKLKAPNTADEKFEEVVKSAQDAAVLVLVY